MCRTDLIILGSNSRVSPWRPRWGNARDRGGRSFVIIEFLGFVFLTMALLALLVLLTVQYAQVRREYDARRELYLAAETVLQRVRAGIRPAVPEPADPQIAARPSRIELQTRTTPGEGAWAGMTRMQVVARKRVSGRRVVEVSLSGYVGGVSEAEP